jgi:hypothetical protein
MMAPDVHVAAVELRDPPPAEIAVGADMVLTVRVTCPAGCDLADAPLTVTAPDGSVLAVPPSGADRTIALTAPRQVGEHVWRVIAAPHEVAGVRHEAVPLAVAVRARSQETSLAVWAMPSPVVTGQRFAVKVGAKSAAGCDLNGCKIEIRDENDAVMASGSLGATPWPGTSALYWAELELLAPPAAGMFAWSVRFEAAELALAHGGASARFSIPIVEPPEHRLTVKVVEQATAAPVADAQVRLGPYRGATGQSGLAEIMMPKGTYDLNIWKPGYEAPAQTVAIDADLTVEIAVAAMPEENPDAAWLM